MAKKYDAVVIGAGLGGMSAATFLAKSGSKILLLDRHNIPGGYANTFCRGRFEFDISLHVLSGIGIPGERGDLYNYLDSIGVAQKVEFLNVDELFRVVDDDFDLTVPTGRDKCQEFYADNFPKEAEGIEEVFDTMKDLMGEYMGVIGAASTGRKDIANSEFPTFRKYGMKTFGEVLNRFITDKNLKNALSPFWGYAGLPPSKLPFHLMAAVWEAFLVNPPQHIRGRSMALSNAFMDSFFESGGDLRLNTGVKKIITGNGGVTGIVTDDGEEIKTETVISNANPLTTMVDLVGVDNTPKNFIKEINSRLVGFSTVNLFIGLDCPPEEIGANVHENFIKMSTDIEEVWETGFTLNPPPGFLFTCYNATDPEFSPPGTTAIVMTATSYARPWYMLSPEKYVETKNAIAESMIDLADKYHPGLKGHIEVIEVATPITNMRYTGNPGGAIYGFEQYLSDSGLLRLRHKSPIDGLYFASAWTIPGGGYQPSISSGAIAGGMALKKLKK